MITEKDLRIGLSFMANDEVFTIKNKLDLDGAFKMLEKGILKPINISYNELQKMDFEGWLYKDSKWLIGFEGDDFVESKLTVRTPNRTYFKVDYIHELQIIFNIFKSELVYL